MSTDSDFSAAFSQVPCRSVLDTSEAVSTNLQRAQLDADQRNRLYHELTAAYRHVTRLTGKVGQTASAGAYYQLDSVGTEWPIIDPRASQMTNSVSSQTWIAKLLEAVAPNLVSGGTNRGETPTRSAGR